MVYLSTVSATSMESKYVFQLLLEKNPKLVDKQAILLAIKTYQNGLLPMCKESVVVLSWMRDDKQLILLQNRTGERLNFLFNQVLMRIISMGYVKFIKEYNISLLQIGQNVPMRCIITCITLQNNHGLHS